VCGARKYNEYLNVGGGEKPEVPSANRWSPTYESTSVRVVLSANPFHHPGARRVFLLETDPGE